MARKNNNNGENVKRVSAKKAEELRAIEIIKESEIDCFVAPTPHVSSGSNGRVTELVNTPSYSTKTAVSKQGVPDIHVRFMDNGKRVSKCVEVKTNSGEITSIVKSLERGYDGLVLYDLNICNSNTSYKRRAVSPRIMRFSTFLALLEECGAIRRDKTSTRGAKVVAIESTKAKLPKLLELQTEYDDSRYMDLAEIQ